MASIEFSKEVPIRVIYDAETKFEKIKTIRKE